MVMLVNWLLTHWWILLAALVLAVLVGAGWFYHRQQRGSGRPCGRKGCGTACRSRTRCTTPGSRTRSGS
ncbi:hypothetical protein ACGFOM_29115 [Streptomyces sp. NPDC048594]|uniref:hypothetical protein n=1 Tax=Streptomyces sp. NPDC048594 TaxID=3365575 RepID=UPI003722D064